MKLFDFFKRKKKIPYTEENSLVMVYIDFTRSEYDIINDIEKIKGVINADKTLTGASFEIIVFAYWDNEDEMRLRVKEIESIKGIKSVDGRTLIPI